MAFLDDFPKLAAYPMIVKVIGEDLVRKTLNELREAYFNPNRPLHQKKQSGYSRGFWNTLAIAAFESKPGRLAVATFYAQTIERGLEAAARAGKAVKFKAALIGQDPNFVQTVAELHVLSMVGSLASSVDIELPGKDPKKNYDGHFVIDGIEVHIDSKWRTPTPLGEIINGSEATQELDGLLRPGFDAVAIAYVATNRLSQENVWEIAFIVDDIRKFIRAGQTTGTPVNAGNVHSCISGTAYNWVASYLINGGLAGRAGTAQGTRFVSIPAHNVAFVESGLLEKVEFKNMLPEGSNGMCLLMPKSETQPMYESSEPGEHDHRHPEHKGIATLIGEVSSQLPAAPYNVVALGLPSYELFEDAELAVLGIPDGATRKGGVFSEQSFKDVSGVLAFSMVPPSPQDGRAAEQWANYWANPNCSTQLPQSLVDKIRGALGREGKVDDQAGDQDEC